MKKQNKGFTLIELMVVVAIIGILAAVAVPRFLRFMAQSRRTETKTILSAVYIAEAATKEGLNYNASQAAATLTGYTDLFNAGFNPASPVKLYTKALAANKTVAGPVCNPGAKSCAPSEITYDAHIGLSFTANSASIGDWYNAGMCGDPDINGTASDQFQISSDGGREPVLCKDDLNAGVAPNDSTGSKACTGANVGC